MRVIHSIVMAVGLTAAGLGTGCVALAVGAAAGVGTYAYVEGQMKTTLEANLDRTWEATKDAMKDLQFPITESSKDALEARAQAVEADETKVTIHLERKGENLTEVRVRVGVFGNEGQSRLILDKIKAHL